MYTISFGDDGILFFLPTETVLKAFFFSLMQMKRSDIINDYCGLIMFWQVVSLFGNLHCRILPRLTGQISTCN